MLTQLPEQHKSRRQTFKLNEQKTARNLLVNLDRRRQVLTFKLANALSKGGSPLSSRATPMLIHVVDPETGDAKVFTETYLRFGTALFQDK